MNGSAWTGFVTVRVRLGFFLVLNIKEDTVF